jgi:hypothetical protein
LVLLWLLEGRAFVVAEYALSPASGGRGEAPSKRAPPQGVASCQHVSIMLE